MAMWWRLPEINGTIPAPALFPNMVPSTFLHAEKHTRHRVVLEGGLEPPRTAQHKIPRVT